MDRLLYLSPDEILEHMGAPIITAANTVFVPVRVSDGVYAVEIHNGSTGVLRGTLNTDWTPPAHDWIPSYGPGLSSRNRFYYPGAGGTVYYVDSPDTNNAASGQLAFYGLANYQSNSAAFNSTVIISTPIVGDRYGDIFFGFIVTGSNPANLQSGVPRISASGVGTWVSAVSASGGDTGATQLPLNGAPALSNDHLTLYFPVSGGGFGMGYLTAVNATTLAPIAHVRLKDPGTGLDAYVPDDGSAVPTIGPDGDVFYGVLDNGGGSNNFRGWLLHFNSTLTALKTPGAFGWDDTPSIVPRALVPQYIGPSQYLIFTKYNNYKDHGGSQIPRVSGPFNAVQQRRRAQIESSNGSRYWPP